MEGAILMIVIEFKCRKDTILKIAETGNSMREFSKHIGMSQGYLSQLLNGEKKPSPTIAGKIAKGLGVKIEDIFFVKVIDKTINREIIKERAAQ